MYFEDILNKLKKLSEIYEHIKGVPDISSDLEIINCELMKIMNLKHDLGYFMIFGVYDLRVHKCSLRIKDLSNMIKSLRNHLAYDTLDFSSNLFDKTEENYTILKQW